jgi:hypothetical protein
MTKKLVAAFLAIGFLGGLLGFTVRGDDRPAGAKPGIEYKALVRKDIESLAPEPIRKGQVEGANIEALTAGLNGLAKNGWELVAIEPYYQYQVNDVQAVVTFHSFPTYVLKRAK